MTGLAFLIGLLLGAGMATLVYGLITIRREDRPEPRRAA